MAQQLTNNQKTAILVFGSAIALFFFFVRPRLKAPGTAKDSDDTAPLTQTEKDDVSSRTPITEPTINQKDLKSSKKVFDSYNALKAYIAAYNAGESQEDLNQMIRDLRKRFSVVVYKKSDGRMAVRDLVGKDIIVNDFQA